MILQKVMKLIIKKVWSKFVKLWIWIWNQLKDWKTLLIFIIVVLIISFEVWGFYLIGIITQNGWWIATASACWIFWLGPGTPFIPLCVGITLGIKEVYLKIKRRK